jgi:Tfp pilus assembly protein PilN
VRAVNLIPNEARRGGGAGSAGRAGSAVYIVLGALGVLVVAMAVYVMTGNQVTSRKGEVAKANQDATTLEQQAAALKPYAQFASLSESRLKTVASLADSRFDWERAMRDLARALPGDVWLTSVVGTVAPGVNFEGSGGGATSSLRGAVQAPAIEIVGCTDSQSSVSRVMARLRTMHGVQSVSLASSEKAQGAVGPAGGGGGNSGDCRNGNGQFPQFQLVVFFDAPKSAQTTPGQGATPPQGATPQGATPPANQSVNQTASNGAGQ